MFACVLDHFKVVNDGLGHPAGDEVLIEVARRMRRCVRPTDLATRLGGDEFVIVMDGPGAMAQLAAFPWDLLKIDQSFVSGLGGVNGNAEQVVKSTIAMAHALGITTIGEGVETSEQLNRLADLGCDVAQGFLFARPAAARNALDQVAADGWWTGPGSLALHP